MTAASRTQSEFQIESISNCSSFWGQSTVQKKAQKRGLASTCCTPLSVSNPLVRRFQPFLMDSCRYGAACWRPLCSLRARRWACTQVGRGVEEEEEEDLKVIEVIQEEPWIRPSWSSERHSRDDGGYSQGAHLGVCSRTVLRCGRRARSPPSGRSDGEAEASSGSEGDCQHQKRKVRESCRFCSRHRIVAVNGTSSIRMSPMTERNGQLRFLAVCRMTVPRWILRKGKTVSRLPVLRWKCGFFPRSASRSVHRSLMCQCLIAGNQSINQVTKHAEFPQTLYIDKVVVVNTTPKMS